MFEGLVRQLLQGYLGSYVKDFQREQLKITLWNEEVLLENVELILEAFDYLQLPFALREGRVGRLSIRIPWKKLGWDPIIIILEDVFMSASQRDDEEWCPEAVDKREYAAKKAKLVTAELAKLSRRVSANKSGKSFISYITAKILDSIQVSIRNFHILYRDLHYGPQADPVDIILGLQFSSLTIMKQTTSSARGVVSKAVEIAGFAIYCSSSHGSSSLSADSAGDFQSLRNGQHEGNPNNHILEPMDVYVSLLVDRSGSFDVDAPQFSVTAEISDLVIAVDEVQLRQILLIWDKLCISQIREKYGRYRPWSSPLSSKSANWQKLWWRYAQESVLSDVRRSLKKSSWRSFGERLSYRRQYVDLYKQKLLFLRQDQSVEENIIQQLEQMEKESDIDDIINYRSVAEHELEELVVTPTDGDSALNGLEKSQNSEQSSSRPRGWLNWLSRGMLGAGGTEDSSQFSGVISDEVIKDIYEATEFQPPPLINGAGATERLCRCGVKFSIHDTSAIFRSMKSRNDVAKFLFKEASVEYKIWDESSSIITVINSIEVTYPQYENVILLMQKDMLNPSCRIQVDLTSSEDVQVSLEIAIEPLRVSYDSEFFMNIMTFYDVLQSVEFQHKRVVSSLNGIRSNSARLLSKSEYVLSTRGRIAWDININDILISVPWTNSSVEYSEMVLGFEAFAITSNFGQDDQSSYHNEFVVSNAEQLQLQDLYDHFSVKVTDFQVEVVGALYHQPLSVLEKFSANLILAFCIIPDESIDSIPKQLEVNISASSFLVHFSPSIYAAAMGLISYLDGVHQKFGSVSHRSSSPDDEMLHHASNALLGFSLTANLDQAEIHVDFENGVNSTSCMLSMSEIDARCKFTDFSNCWLSTKAIRIICYPQKDKRDALNLCLFGPTLATNSGDRYDDTGRENFSVDEKNDTDKVLECLLVRYEASRCSDSGPGRCMISLNNGDLHCYPFVISLLVRLFDQLAKYDRPEAENSSIHLEDERIPLDVAEFGNRQFGFSNFLEPGVSQCPSISLDHFPFVSVHNSGCLSSLESSLLYFPDWRKHVKTRQRKPRNKSTIKEEVISCLSSSLKSTLDKNAFPVLETKDSELFHFDLDLHGIRVHFHDHSCTVGIIALPIVQSTALISNDSVDIMCSSEGLVLTSSWWTQRLHDFLWGPSSEDYPPILNVRVRNQKSSVNPQTEVSIGIQHVRCILPPEYLAILIGYFSLPDWMPDLLEQFEENRHVDGDKEVLLIYKVEVLDSDLFVPTDIGGFQFLKVDIPQLHLGFILDSLNGLLESIPAACSVQENRVAKRSDCLNIFGRNLSLSLLMRKDEDMSLPLAQEAGISCFTLIASLDADVWVRIPVSSPDSFVTPTCIMGKINYCELVANDRYLSDGLEALSSAIDEVSSVKDKSMGYTGEMLQPLGAIMSHKIGSLLPNDSKSAHTEVLLSANLLTVKLNQSMQDSMIVESVANAEMQFTCSVSLKNDIPQSLKLAFTSFTLHSAYSSLILARCSATCFTTAVLDITFSVVDLLKNEVSIFLPSLEIWLELTDWMKVLDAVNFAGGEGKTVDIGSLSSATVGSIPHNRETAYGTLSLALPDNTSISGNEDSSLLVLRFENMGIMCYCPFPLQNQGEPVFQQAGHPDISPDVLVGEHRKFVSVSMCSRNTELFLTERSSRIKTCIEKITADVAVREEKSLSSWPLFQIVEVTLEAEVCNNQTEILHVATEMQCDHVDVSLSHQVFSFWHDIELNFPEGGSSQFSIGSIDCRLNFRKVSLLVTDGRLRCSGPLLEVLLRNFIIHAKASKTLLESSVASDLQVNYNNIHKVTWEPFIEPWNFLITITRKREISVLLKSSIVTELYLRSVAQLNLNVTESFFECVCRTTEMMKDAWGLMRSNGISKSSTFFNPLVTQSIPTGRDAPYVIQNLTSLSLAYCTFVGPANLNEFPHKDLKDWNYVEPGSSTPIFISQTPEEQVLRFRPASSSDRLNEKQSNGTSHRYIIIQLDGTSSASEPISMDLVGVSYFEVDFSKASTGERLERTRSASRLMSNPEERANTGKGFVVPVVFDVSIQRFSKLIKLYSTVIVLNETPMPLELRFDIPFGVSPKVLDPVNPSQQFPLPLHLAESGRVGLRPQGNSYVWSEPHNLRTVLSQDRSGFLRSFVCYPSHLRGDPFRCCISVKRISLPSLAKSKNEVSKRFLYQLALSTPLVIHNYLPEAVSLIIECGGVKHPTLLSEVDTSFHQIDPSHDMGLEFHMPGYKLAVSRFPHAETFRTSAKFSGTNFTLSEILVLDPDTANGPIHVTLEKRVDAFSGARELFIYVPFLLYNCLGFALDISDSASELTDNVYTMSSCYDLVVEDIAQAKKDGLSLISSNQDKIGVTSRIYSPQHHTPNGSMVSSRIVKGLPLIAPSSSRVKSYQRYLEDERTTSDKGRHLINLPELRDSNMLDEGHARVRAFSYSPCFSSHAGDNMVRVRRHLPELGRGIQQRIAWSDPFPLDPASGSISILVPQAIHSAAYVVSVTSSALSEPFSGRTRAISFQPRFVISNACGRELCYKQKGTDSVFYLGVGQHTTLQWTDTKRDLLVSICYSEPGWQWSGSFLPDLLGDTQVKLRNYISGALNMIRVEVQYADVSIRDEQIVASLRGNSGTNLILLSDDDSGYMPYRVENFSKERLRIHQLKCENFETILHSYQSCPYAWDEPCYPHRLVLEVPGERVLGSYALDDVNESMNVHLPATSEKPERMLLVSVHAEGATKVLRVVDSSYHVYKDMKDPGISSTAKKNKPQQKRQSFSDYNEKVSISIPYVGISLINSIPQELLFACAKGLTIDILQSVDQQKVSFQLSSLQIDNLLRTEQYPVILSFDGERRGRSKDHDDGYQNKCEELQIHSDSSCDSVICLAVGKWRKKDVSLISFEYIILRVAEFHLELEQEVASHVSELLRTIYLRFDSGGLPVIDPKVAPFFYDMVPLEDSRPPQPDLRRSMANGGLGNCLSLPSVIPIGAPWQQFCHLARRQKKIYVELFDLAPIRFSLSFCSSPWMVGFGIPLSGESLMHRGLMALADIEGARIYLKQLTISHQMAGWESIQEILLRHYSRQLLHEMYKVLGSAGVIGNPMGFARSLGLGIKDFVSVPTTHILQSPAGLVKGMAKGTTSLLSSTVYALSDATSQFTKAAQKGIVALTFDEQAAARMEQQQRGAGSSSQGVINEVLEGLTGLLQSPIRGAEKHGLPGVLSGMVMGLTGLVARPAASILEVTAKTAQSIRNRSKHHHQMGGKRLRVRLPRPLRPHLPLKPYSWEEAIGTCVLVEAAGSSHNSSSSSSGGSNTNLIRSMNKGDVQEEDQVLVSCKALKEAGKFVVITQRLIIVVSCPSLVDFDKPDFQGIPANPEWVIESEIYIDSVIHCDADENTVHIVGSASSSDGLLLRQKQQHHKLKGRKWHTPTTLPLFQTDLELASPEDARLLLSILLSTIEHGKEGRWGTSHVIHRTNIR